MVRSVSKTSICPSRTFSSLDREKPPSSFFASAIAAISVLEWKVLGRTAHALVFRMCYGYTPKCYLSCFWIWLLLLIQGNVSVIPLLKFCILSVGRGGGVEPRAQSGTINRKKLDRTYYAGRVADAAFRMGDSF